MKPCKYGGKYWVIVTFVQLSKMTIECGNTIIYADRMKCLLLACCTGNREKLIKTTSTSLFTSVFAKFANFVWARPTTMFIIQTVPVSTPKEKKFLFFLSGSQNCLYDKHRCRWPYLDKVGKFGKH